mgnify:CR=1 FL=1
MNFITKTDISIGPQLGSQMSQYAGLYSVSKNTKHNIVFFEECLSLHRGIKLFAPFKNLSCSIVKRASVDNSIINRYTLENSIKDVNAFSIDPTINWDIMGLFHLYHYWNDYKEDIIKEFEFDSPILKTATDFISSISEPDTPIISMHFRRTDYLEVSSLNLSLDYYWEAIQFLIGKLKYFKLLVFSDDIQWCKENVVGENIIYSEHNSLEDMCIMSLCDHNIIANSSFSWWGAYLNKNPSKIVICPDKYLLGGDCEFVNYNYYPSDWIAIKI